MSDHDQPMLWPGADPDEVVAEAVAEHSPIARFCLCSGGHDSTTLAHRMRDHYDELVFIDTGTAVPGVVEFVHEFAAWIEKPLRVLETPPEFYREIVLGRPMSTGQFEGMGFPGPAQHQLCYTRLKERMLRILLKETKEGAKRSDCVMFLTGTRRQESARRFRTTRTTYRREKGMLWVSPLIDWSNSAMRAYRRDNEIPESDPAALLHRSGECNCGCFAAEGEREELKSLYPEWFERVIGSLEREAEAAGKKQCRWGTRFAEAPEGDAGDLCSDCQLRIEAAAPAE